MTISRHATVRIKGGALKLAPYLCGPTLPR
jgi:hypothetical protein